MQENSKLKGINDLNIYATKYFDFRKAIVKINYNVSYNIYIIKNIMVSNVYYFLIFVQYPFLVS